MLNMGIKKLLYVIIISSLCIGLSHAMENDQRVVDEYRYIIKDQYQVGSIFVYPRNGWDEVGKLQFNSYGQGLWDIGWFWIHPNYRNKKLGTQLFLKFFSHIKQYDPEVVKWLVLKKSDAEKNASLAAMYRHLVEKVQIILPGELTEYPDADNKGIHMTYCIGSAKSK